jgi:hypothetical protein
MSEFLGQIGIAMIGVGQYTGHQLRALVLEEYDVSNDTYVGVTHFEDDQFTKTFQHVGKGVFAEGRTANVAVAVRIPGLRRYPYAERPDYSFQFVLAGESVEPLREIAARNAKNIEQGGDVVIEEVQDEQAVDTRPTWQKKGFASKADWKSAGSPE